MARCFFLLLAFLIFSSSALGADKIIVASGILGSTVSESAYVVVREAYNKIGLELKVEWGPGDVALEKSNGGIVDAELLRLDGVTRRFPNLVQVPIPVNFDQVGVFSRDVSILVNGYQSLKSYRIAIMKGVVFSEQGTDGMDVKRADSYSGALRMVLRNEVDVAILLKFGGLATIKKENLAGIKLLEGTPEILLFYHYVHKRHKEMAGQLENVLKQMLLDGTTRRLLEKANSRYLPDGDQQ